MTEIPDAHCWYEQRQPGLGHFFTSAVDSTIATIVRRPLSHRRVRGETRRALIGRFPFSIYFRVLSGEIVVLAVMHNRQDPRRWQARH